MHFIGISSLVTSLKWACQVVGRATSLLKENATQVIDFFIIIFFLK